ncbi:hypothetical protein N665_0010s0018 [Sinapis alba]|nr:hypothetical protein N665_0010s0018 [Sinapis alba]
MEARKGIICGLAAYRVKPQLKQKQPQQETFNTAQIKFPKPKKGQSSGVNDVCSRGYLIRIEEPEERIEPLFRICIRDMNNSARNSAPMRRRQQEQEQS